MKGQLKPPIFLLGNVRSGTSMMHDLFNMFPKIVSWYEPRTVWVYAAPARRHDRFDETDATPRVVRYIRKRFLKYQLKHDNKRVMEKTPSNLLRIPYVHKIFPESKYVYLIRSPLAYISSSELRWQETIHLSHAWERFLETPKLQLPYYVGRLVRDHFNVKVLRRQYASVWGVRYPGIYDDLEKLSVEQVIARQWAFCSAQVEKDLAKLDPSLVLRLRYEDFVDDPVTHFERVCRHFGLSMAAELGTALRDQVDATRHSKWRRLDARTVQRCIPEVQDEMRRHGYELPEDVRHLMADDVPKSC